MSADKYGKQNGIPRPLPLGPFGRGLAAYFGIVFIDFLPVESRVKQRTTYVFIFNYTHSTQTHTHNPLRNARVAVRVCVCVCSSNNHKVDATRTVPLFHCLFIFYGHFECVFIGPDSAGGQCQDVSLKSELQHS